MGWRIYTFTCIVWGILLPWVTNAQVTANFSSSITTGCAPILVQFTDQSTGSPTSWLWDLGNGTTSTLQNPSTTYLNPGTYTVSLKVGDGSMTNTKTVTNYITVAPAPGVNFVASDSTPVCAPHTVSFTNLSTPGTAGAVSYLWDFGDGNTSTASSPDHNYTSPGNYNVTLNVTNSSGCSKLLTKANYVKISQVPTAGFTSANNNSCSFPLSVSFNNTSVGATAYFWDFGDGSISTSASPSHTYTSPGSYNVSLVATNSDGCGDTVVANAFVNVGAVSASFTTSTTSACTNNTIVFTNTSTPGPGLSTWSFGDGTMFTGTNAVKSYSTPGTYTVKLVVNNGASCTDSTSQTIVVNQGPTAAFTATLTNGCSAPFTTQFNNATTGAVSYLWLFGDGTTSTAANPSKTYSSLGTYSVTLVAFSADGCSDTISLPNYIVVAPPIVTLSVSPAEGCVPLSVNFTASVPGSVSVSSYTWDFGDGTVVNGGANMSHVYTSVGTFSVTVQITTTAGCNSSSAIKTVKVGTKPTVAFTGSPTTVCPDADVHFQNSTVGAAGTTYQWYFGDGETSVDPNPTHVYGAPGTYTVTLVATNNGCSDTLIVQDMITVELPEADFTIGGFNCINRKQLTFSDNSTGATSWLWDFGDGTTSTLQNPVHTYANFGGYAITLSVTNAATGCTSTQTQPLFILDLVSDFSVNDTTICKGDTAVFTALSSPYYYSYAWSFGDGTSQTSSTNIIKHSYTMPGTYDVQLIVQDGIGCYDTLLRTSVITVGGPEVDFTGVPTSGCTPLLVNFTDQSNTGSLSTAARFWIFGDGSTDNSNQTNPSHLYSTGVYNVRLKVTDALGCTDSLTKNHYILVEEPEAAFTANNTTPCVGQPLSFTNNSVGNGLSYSWDFGDGNTSTAAAPTHTYSSPGIYTVRLIATSALGCKDTSTKPGYIQVFGLNATFTASDTFASCPPLAVNFTNTSGISGSQVWTFGNGNSANISNPSTVYSLPGSYTVMLKVYSGGCVDSMTKTITVLGPTGTLSYSPLSGCHPLTVQFSSTSTNTQQLLWDMSDGTILTGGSTVSYTYTQPGIYVPKLLLNGGAACIVPIVGQDTIRVNEVETDFSFTSGNVCEGSTVQFFDTTLSTFGPLTQRFWDFGDGSTANTHNPAHQYAAAGTYTVQFVGVSGPGCTDTVVKTITILPLPIVDAGNDVVLCAGQTGPLQLQASGALSYIWSPGLSLSCTNCSDPQASPAVTTTYTVVGTAANGCSNSSQVTVAVVAPPVVVVSPSATICEGATTQLNASGAQSYSWTPSAGLSCTNCPNPVAAPAVTTTYTVTGTSADGCTDTASVTVTVNPLPQVNVVPSISTICVGDNVQLNATGADSYVWSPVTGLSCSTCPTPIASPNVTTSYVVTGSAGNGCTDTAVVTIKANPLPLVNAGTDQTICEGESVQLTATGGSSYSWMPGSYLSCTNCADPVATPISGITYTVTGTDANGCSNMDSVTIHVINITPMSVGPGDTICAGESVQLSATGGDNYLWTPAMGLDNPATAAPLARPDATTTYSVIINQGSCFTDTLKVKVVVVPQPTVNAGGDQTMLAGTPVTLFANATHATSYLWTPAEGLNCSDCQSPQATPKATTTYTVVVSNELGCQAQDEVIVFVRCDKSLLFMANTFTPNGDGNNDRFYPQGRGIATIQRFRIYNRWGELMFDAANIQPNEEQHGWDGTYKGEQLRPDVFVYVVDAMCDTGEPLQLKGDISLIR